MQTFTSAHVHTGNFKARRQHPPDSRRAYAARPTGNDSYGLFSAFAWRLRSKVGNLRFGDDPKGNAGGISL